MTSRTRKAGEKRPHVGYAFYSGRRGEKNEKPSGTREKTTTYAKRKTSLDRGAKKKTAVNALQVGWGRNYLKNDGSRYPTPLGRSQCAKVIKKSS